MDHQQHEATGPVPSQGKNAGMWRLRTFVAIEEPTKHGVLNQTCLAKACFPHHKEVFFGPKRSHTLTTVLSQHKSEIHSGMQMFMPMQTFTLVTGLTLFVWLF